MARPADPQARQALLVAAAKVFAEKGLEQARIADITSRAGKAKGSFYLHFASKEEAFRELVKDMVERVSLLIPEPQLAAFESRSGMEHLLREALQRDVALFRYLYESRELARLVFSGSGSMAFSFLVESLGDRARETCLKWLSRGQALGWYRTDMDLELLSHAVAGSYDKVARAVIASKREPDLPRWVGELQRFVARGIGTTRLVELTDRLAIELAETPSSPPSAPKTRTPRKSAHAS